MVRLSGDARALMNVYLFCGQAIVIIIIGINFVVDIIVIIVAIIFFVVVIIFLQ